MMFGDELAGSAVSFDNSAMPETASEQDKRKNDCETLVAATLDLALSEEATERLPATDVRHLAEELIREVFEPNGFLRDRARKEPLRLVEMVGAATLPAVTQGRRENVARILVEMLEYAKLIGFEPETAADNWPRLKARALRGRLVA